MAIDSEKIIHAKIAQLEADIASLRDGYMIVNKRYAQTLDSMKLLTQSALEAALRAANAAEKAAQASKNAAAAAMASASAKIIDATHAATEAASLAAVAAAGYWAYNKAAPIIADVRSMMQLMEEQQKAESLKARELDPCVFVFFEVACQIVIIFTRAPLYHPLKHTTELCLSLFTIQFQHELCEQQCDMRSNRSRSCYFYARQGSFIPYRIDQCGFRSSQPPTLPTIFVCIADFFNFSS